MDAPDKEKGGGANHQYDIGIATEGGSKWDVHCQVHFQHGPVKDCGVNGITNEALMAIVIDRLRSFQRGPFACRENALALTNLEQSMMWLHKRTLDRVRRGVEGKHEV